jgi:hypothetical protein
MTLVMADVSGNTNNRAAGGAGGFKLVGIALGVSFTRSRLAWRWVHMAQACRSIRISSRADTTSYSRKTPPWKLLSGTRPSGPSPSSPRPPDAKSEN